MAREWIDPESGTQVLEDGVEVYIHPAMGAQIQENQAAPGGDPESRLVGGKLVGGGLLIKGSLA